MVTYYCNPKVDADSVQTGASQQTILRRTLVPGKPGKTRITRTIVIKKRPSK